LLEKDVVLFYGVTGSGKSTTINFLIDLPLKEAVNKYGDNVI
jgi:Tfp pilus assembly pilus retraction ATPase PilT